MIQYTKGCLPVSRNTHRKRGELYNQDIFSFDIEVSSGWIDENGQVLQFDADKAAKFYEDLTPVSLCYIWQFSYNDVVYYGRELSEFAVLVDELQHKAAGVITVWVHNLSYEFQFLVNIFEFDKIFARTAHKVMYADFERVRFRCTYFLTHLSLEQWAKDKKLPVQKLAGALDYIKLRTPRTILSDTDMLYCEFDCLVVYHGIMQYKAKYKHIEDIPLTQTGEVRRPVKKLFHNDYRHFRKCTELLPRDFREYARLKAAFAGGWTHANVLLAGKVLHNVTSRDIASSYPTVMCAEKYPMSKWQAVRYWREYYNDDYCLIMDVTFRGLEATTCNNYLSESKAYFIKNPARDNGRIIAADDYRIIFTGVDFDIVKRCYKWDTMTVNNCWVSVADYLPTPFVNYILELYADKTELKGIEEYSSRYDTSKQYINSLYGMCVTAILQENVLYNNGNWTTEILTPEAINAGLDKLRNQPFKNYLVYAHGVFVTAYARRNLWTPLLNDSALEWDTAYCDTDSIKYIGSHDDVFNDYNKHIIDKLNTAMEHHGIDPERTRPKDAKGIAHQLGVFEFDGQYEEFVTLGAKRYAYRKNGELHITVSGVSKARGVKELNDDITNFNDGLIFSYDNCGKLLVSYLDEQPRAIWNKGQYDEYASEYSHGVNMRPTTYSMSLTGEYLDLILTVNDSKENFSNMDATDLHNLIVAPAQQKGN